MNPQSPPTLLEYITAFGSIATPIFVLIASGIGWAIARRWEKIRQLEEKLREDRIAVYNSILEPFIILFTTDEGLSNKKEYRGKVTTQVARDKILSLEYRQAAFKLSLIGSDDVFRAYNNLMQYFYSLEPKQKETSAPEDATISDPKDMLSYLGKLLLAIRISVGNETTTLHHLEMLEFLIKDIRKFQKYGKY